MGFIVLTHALFFSGVGLVASLFRTKRQSSRPDWAGALLGGALSFVFVAFGTWFVLMVGEPSMDHQLEAGGWGLSLLNLVTVIIALAISDAIGAARRKFELPYAPTALVVIIAVVLTVFGYPIDAGFVNHPDQVPCDSIGHAQMVTSILPVNPATQGTSNDKSSPDYKYADLTQPDSNAVPPTNPDMLIRVTPEMATAQAQQNFTKLNTKEVPVTSFTELNHVYLQKYQGHWYYVADLQVNNFRAYDQYHDVIPGYLLISAEDPTAPVQAMTGFRLSYVPGIGIFSWDLERTVHFNWTLNHTQYEVLDLSAGLEIDEQGNPYYLGTLVSPVDGLGAAGKRVVGMIQVNPKTGDVIQWDLKHIPAWVDRVYPEDYLHSYLSDYWAPYFDRDACNLGNTAGQAEIESDGTYQITGSPGDPTGAAFVYTYTSHKNPNAILGEVVVDPRTGYTKAYAISGASYRDAVDLVDSAIGLHIPKGSNVAPSHCQIHQIYGKAVWYCILISKGRYYYGVALLQTRYSNDASAVIVDDVSLTNALSRLQDQIATGDLQDNANLKRTEQKDVSFQGVVTHTTNGSYQRNGHTYMGFIIDGTSVATGKPIPPGVTFVADVTGDVSGEKFRALPWVQVGNHVFVTANVIPGSSEYTLTSVSDPDVFPPTPTPSVVPSAPAPSPSPKR